MSAGGTLQPGPWEKSSAWRAGAFLLGLALLLLLVDFILGGLVDIGFGRLLTILIGGGLILSAPYGLGRATGRQSRAEPAAPAPPPPRARVQTESGSTYVILAPADPPAAAAPAGPRMARPRDLSPGWYVLYTVFYRWPLMVGDYVLSGLWRLVGRIWGFRSETGTKSVGDPERGKLHADRVEAFPRPDRDTF